MSDHISGPRALSDPIADITDVYAFPSPERPGRLVLVMNTLPFAKPWDALSEGLIYRFRLRPLTPSAAGGEGHGVRVFAGGRWDPFIMDAPAALKTIATGKLAFTDPSSIFLDGKDVLSLVVELDTALLGGAELLAVVAETLTRGAFNVRIERVGRPEVKNMMLAPKQFDPVNRDLEIRDLYNSE